MLIDTHAHIYLDRFDEDRDAMLDRARAAGVGAILMPAIDVASIHDALALCEENDDLYAMAALHPSETKEAGEDDFERVEALAERDCIVAIGETGLDYYWDRGFDEKQHDMLRRHIRLAARVDLPLVFHNREADEDLVRILREEIETSDYPERIRGVFHCFGGPPWLAHEILELGFHAGIGGTLTFKNGGVPDAIADVPLERIVLETDAPFLAPAPNRGKRNEPSWVRFVAEKLAEVRGVTVREIESITTANACRVFGIEVG